MPDRFNPLRIQPPPEARTNMLAGPPQPDWAGATDENIRLYNDFLARDRQRQIAMGHVDPQTGALTPEGWRAQAQTVAGGFGPADVGMAGGFGGLIKNYHGSPHLFPPTPKNPLGEFNPAKIGTGEGGQAFGVGAGYTGAESTARFYKDSLSGPPAQAFDNLDSILRRVGGYGPVSEADIKHNLTGFPLLTKFADDPEFIRSMQHILPDYNPGAAVTGENLRHYRILNDKIDTLVKPGHMYEVNIHAEPEHYLDLDKPLDAQSPHVQRAFQAGPTLSRLMQEHDVPPNVTTAEDWLTHMTTPRLTGMKPKVSPAELSEALQEAGVAGYRYLDAGSRGKANDPDATHNHVTFDPNIMEIVRRFGIAGLIGGGAAATAAGGQDHGNQ